jgi:hypothetical protein
MEVSIIPFGSAIEDLGPVDVTTGASCALPTVVPTSLSIHSMNIRGRLVGAQASWTAGAGKSIPGTPEVTTGTTHTWTFTAIYNAMADEWARVDNALRQGFQDMR